MTNEAVRRTMLPEIPVPEKFDAINSSYLITEYQSAKTSGLSSIILSQLQKEIAEKKFYANPDVSAFITTVMDLNPFSDKTAEDISLMQSSGLVTKQDAVLSVYITDFVKQALEDDKNFNSKTIAQKREVLLKYAKEKVTQLSSVKAIAPDIIPGSALPDEQPEETMTA